MAFSLNIKKVLVPSYYRKISSDPREAIMFTFFVVVSCSLKYRLNFEFIPRMKEKSLMSDDGEHIEKIPVEATEFLTVALCATISYCS